MVIVSSDHAPFPNLAQVVPVQPRRGHPSGIFNKLAVSEYAAYTHSFAVNKCSILIFYHFLLADFCSILMFSLDLYFFIKLPFTPNGNTLSFSLCPQLACQHGEGRNHFIVLSLARKLVLHTNS